MKKILLIILCLGSLGVQAQKEMRPADANIVNDNEGRLCCFDVNTKKPVEGKIRLIDSLGARYIDIEFDDKGYASGKRTVVVDNVVVSEGNHKDGFLDGIQRDYSPDGKTMLSEKFYVNGSKEGVWREFYDDGTLMSEKSFKADKMSGILKTFFSDGKIESEKGYKDGTENGPEKIYADDGSILRDLNYLDGKPTGKAFYIFTSNTGDYTRTAFYDKNGKLDGDYADIFLDGGIKEKGRYSVGEKDGEWIYGRRDGVKLRTEFYGKGVLIKRTKYFNGGNIEVEEELNEDGKKHGTERKFDNNGNLRSEINYKDGKEHGKSIMNIKGDSENYTVKSNYENGRLDGEYIEKYENGKIKTKGRYVNGNRDGVWTTYHPDGKAESEEEYKNGRPVK